MECAQILIVEDELIVAKSIARNLTKLNYEVVGTVTSGEEAIDFVNHQLPDLILMDIFLQGDIDGIEAAHQIWQLSRIPIIYLTANADMSTVKRAKSTGSFGYIVKPFKPQELQATIEIAISKYREQKKDQKALELSEKLRKEAETLTQLKSRYLSIASHEFKTPLTSILGSSSLLENYSEKLSEGQKRKHLSKIQKAVKQMNQLLEDVLLLGHADSGKIYCYPESIELVEFCGKMIEDFNSIYPNRSIEFSYDRPLIQACLDQNLLRHIINNLLSNALKYSQEHTSIDFQVSSNQNSVIFKISDRGIGIPQDDLNHLFETFHRAKNVGKIPGTGLGLSIVKSFVDIHSGTIEVNSVLNSGTTFTVRLPINVSSNKETSSDD
jgi:signal transduction histidine kinase